MLLQQSLALAIAHAAPDTELLPIVEGLRGALDDIGTVPANHSRLPLRSSANEEFVGIQGPTPCLRNALCTEYLSPEG